MNFTGIASSMEHFQSIHIEYCKETPQMSPEFYMLWELQYIEDGNSNTRRIAIAAGANNLQNGNAANQLERPAPAGMYFLGMQAGAFTAKRKLLLLK